MEKQQEVLEITAKLWNKYLEIPKNEIHPDDNNDIRFYIHAIQNIMFTQLYKTKFEKHEYKIIDSSDDEIIENKNDRIQGIRF